LRSESGEGFEAFGGNTVVRMIGEGIRVEIGGGDIFAGGVIEY